MQKKNLVEIYGFNPNNYADGLEDVVVFNYTESKTNAKTEPFIGSVYPFKKVNFIK